MGRASLLNRVLFTLYVIIGISVLAGAVASPSFRGIAYAPLRDVLLPPPAPIVLDVLYSTEKEAWLEEVVAEFERSNIRINGRPVEVSMTKMGSREIYLSVLDGAQPHVISPASSLQISILADLSASRFGRPLVNPNDLEQCRPMVSSPLVVVAWEDRANALWGADPGKDLWKDLHTALTDPAGWAVYGHPEWGFVKFGHTSPLSSNSGFQTILLLAYDYHNKTSGLSADDVLDPGFQDWLLEIEGAIGRFGDSTGTYMEDIVAYGPSQYDMVAVYESVAIEQAENAAGRYGRLRVYYPPANLLADHPFCVLDAEWVAVEQQLAAQAFLDFLAAPESQQLAMMKYGFRPSEPSIALDQAGSPFLRYTELGIRTDLPPDVEVPEGNVLNALLDLWIRNVQR